MGVAFRPAVRPDNDDGWAEILQEVPACAGDSKQIDVVRYATQYVDRGVMLEEKIHLRSDAANVGEHVAELHVLRIRAKAVKSAYPFCQ